MSPQLVVINGTMGVGKSATARALSGLLQPSLFLDGDWCWTMSPFAPSEADKRMVVGNITHLLRGFLASGRPYVIFCWVLHEDAIWNEIAAGLAGIEYEIHRVTLTCTPDALRERLGRDVAARVREAEVIERSVARLDQFEGLATRKLDVSRVDAQSAAATIAGMVRATP